MKAPCFTHGHIKSWMCSMVGLKSEALNLHSFGLPAYGCKNSLGCTEVLQKHGILWWYGSSQYGLRHTGLETGLQPFATTVCEGK